MPSITFSITNGGAAIVGDAHDEGNAANGQSTSGKIIFLRHDATNPLTNVGFYSDAFSGVYAGVASAAADLAEIRAWGDLTTSTSFGGFQINQDATGAFPTSSWPTYNSHEKGYGSAFNTTLGSSVTNRIALLARSGASAEGEIQAGLTPNVRVKFRFQIPQDEDTPGIRQIDLKVNFSFTS